MFEFSIVTSKARPSPSGAPTVFVVEDDEAIRDALLFLFSSAGLTVQSFSSAEDFLAARPVAGAGCLVLDVHLTGMSGFDLLNRMPKGVASLPVICITGRTDAHLRAQAREAGTFAFLQKPLAEDRLLELVRDAIEQSSEVGSHSVQNA